jgi:hypothetical protein
MAVALGTIPFSETYENVTANKDNENPTAYPVSKYLFFKKENIFNLVGYLFAS